MIFKDIEKALGDWYNKLNLSEIPDKPIKEAYTGAAIQPKGAIPSAEKDKLSKLYEKIHSQLQGSPFSVQFTEDSIIIVPKTLSKDEDSSDFDYSPHIASMLEYMMRRGHQVEPLPEIRVKKDIEESKNLFGKTAYYEPVKKEVVLYTEGRHPKDVLRSFAHEMVHHIQNLEGRLSNVNTSNVNESDELKQLEEEAYKVGSILFREWEDTVKNK